jgi:hypothetical protein
MKSSVVKLLGSLVMAVTLSSLAGCVDTSVPTRTVYVEAGRTVYEENGRAVYGDPVQPASVQH